MRPVHLIFCLIGLITTSEISEEIRNLGSAFEFVNPCNSPVELRLRSSLDITGREGYLKTIAGNMLARMRPLRQICSNQSAKGVMAPIRRNGSVNLVNVYRSAMLISAHMMAMAEDWRNGRNCWNQEGQGFSRAYLMDE